MDGPRYAYLEVPISSIDGLLTGPAQLYKEVLDWHTHGLEDGSKYGFDDDDGNIGGAYVVGGELSDGPGIIPYIYVDDIAGAAIQLTRYIDGLPEDSTGEILHEHPGLGMQKLTGCAFRDTDGNYLGIYLTLPS